MIVHCFIMTDWLCCALLYECHVFGFAHPKGRLHIAEATPRFWRETRGGARSLQSGENSGGESGQRPQSSEKGKAQTGGGVHCKRPSLAGAGTEEGHEEDAGGQPTGRWKGAREAGRLKGAGKPAMAGQHPLLGKEELYTGEPMGRAFGGKSFRQNIGKAIYVYAFLMGKLHFSGGLK